MASPAAIVELAAQPFMSNLWNLTQVQPVTGRRPDGRTVPEVFWDGVRMRGDKVWMRQKELGIWRNWSWNQTGQAVRDVALGLAALGFRPGDCASILSNTVVEWLITDLAIQSAGGVANGIYPTDSASQVQYLCEDSATRVIFVEDEEQLDKVLEARAQLPALKAIIVYDTKGLSRFDDPMVMGFEALRERGRAQDLADPGLFDRLVSSRGPEDLAILVYTSGTTGRPKGAMQSHAALIFAMRNAERIIPQDEQDQRMCFLPLCHIAERLVGAYASMHTGSVLNFVESPDTVPENVREISPTVLFAVPRVWEKFYSAVLIGVKEATRIQQLAYGWAISVGQQVAERALARQPVGVGLRAKFTLARWLALNNVRKLLGIHRAKLLVTGAAPISPDLIRWYLALGIPMVEGWAQTESCALGTFMRPWHIKPGTIGQAADGVEVRVEPTTGELLMRGPNVFMGYLNQPEKTAETIDRDGWLHTGDVGTVDEEGFFRITDRMKDIIITAGGKNVTPSEWENELKFSPFVTDAVVIGDKRPFLTVIIMIDQENVERFAQERDIPFSNYASLTRAPEVRELIQQEIDQVNRKFARVEQIKKFHLLEAQLTAEDEELTPTMKLKRKLVQQKYAPQIEAMYS